MQATNVCKAKTIILKQGFWKKSNKNERLMVEKCFKLKYGLQSESSLCYAYKDNIKRG